MKTWIELREPGCVPERKGAFTTLAQLKAFLIEIFDRRPTALVTVVTIHEGGPSFQDGPECLEMMDGRQRRRAERHRQSTKHAWQFPVLKRHRALMTERMAEVKPNRN